MFWLIDHCTVGKKKWAKRANSYYKNLNCLTGWFESEICQKSCWIQACALKVTRFARLKWLPSPLVIFTTLPKRNKSISRITLLQGVALLQLLHLHNHRCSTKVTTTQNREQSSYFPSSPSFPVNDPHCRFGWFGKRILPHVGKHVPAATTWCNLAVTLSSLIVHYLGANIGRE